MLMKRWITLSMIYALITGVSGSMFRVSQNLFFRAEGLSNTSIGNIQSTGLWGAAFLGLIISLLADKIGRKQVLIAATILTSVSGFLLVLHTDPRFLIVYNFFRSGFHITSVTIVIAALTGYTHGGNRAKVFGLHGGILMGSGVVGNFLGGFLGDFFGLGPSLVFAAAFYLIAVIPLLMIKHPIAEHSEAELRHTVPLVIEPGMQRRILIYYFLSTSFVGFGAGLFIHFGNLIFYDLFQFQVYQIGIILSIAQLSTAVGSALSHRFGKKFGPLRFYLTLEWIVVPLIILMAFVRQPMVFIIIYCLRFAMMNMVSPILRSVVYSCVDSRRLATVSGVNNFLNNAVRGIAAFLFGIIIAEGIDGYQELFLISAVFYAATAVIATLVYRDFEHKDFVKQLYNLQA